MKDLHRRTFGLIVTFVIILFLLSDAILAGELGPGGTRSAGGGREVVQGRVTDAEGAQMAMGGIHRGTESVQVAVRDVGTSLRRQLRERADGTVEHLGR